MNETAQTPTVQADLADLIVHLARLGLSTAATPLTAAQWTALRYFARANRLSRTPSAFSGFHATTRGTASQTVKSLVELGLLERRHNDNDGRSTLLDVTDAGHAMLERDPLEDMRKALARLNEQEQRALSASLGQVAMSLAEAREAPVFGTCVDCQHCEIEKDRSFCHQAQGFLSPDEMAAICVNFRPVSAVI